MIVRVKFESNSSWRPDKLKMLLYMETESSCYRTIRKHYMRTSDASSTCNDGLSGGTEEAIVVGVSLTLVLMGRRSLNSADVLFIQHPKTLFQPSTLLSKTDGP